LSFGDSAAIWANHNAGNAFVKVYNIHKDSAQWNTVTLADTATATLCFNQDQGWYQGALNDIPSADVFDFGWGKYDLVSHNLYGDSIFIIKANNVFYKVYIQSFITATTTWTFSVGDIVAGTSYLDSISKQPNYDNRLFAYYDLATAADTNREPHDTTWDLVFNRYNSLVNLGGPGPQPYPVIGALNNKGVKAVKVNPVHVDSTYAHYSDYMMPWPASSSIISSIGYDWKSFTPPAGPWIVPDSNSYLIQDKTGNLYQLQFTGYSGSGTGNIYFRKRVVAPVAVTDTHSPINQYSFYPNPANTAINLMLNSHESTTAKLLVYDITGKVVLNSQLNIVSGLNGYSFPVNHLTNGHYILSIQGSDIHLNEKLMIAK
jgi:hypothetical protein